MKRVVIVLATVALLASAATAVLIWRLTRNPAPTHAEISAFSHGELVRVGPYKYCDVFKIMTCDVPESEGQLGVLKVNARDPVQLSLPPAIARAPWILLRNYEGGDAVDEFRPDSKIAVTIPTVDAQRGKLNGIVVQLPTLVQNEQGEQFPWPHAEWSVATVWS